MLVLAHAGHWITAAVLLAPLVALVVMAVNARLSDKERDDDDVAKRP